MRWRRPLESTNCFYGRLLEPRELVEREEELATVDQHPEAMLGDVPRNLDLQSRRIVAKPLAVIEPQEARKRL